MSQRREKRRRAKCKAHYEWDYRNWIKWEPPRWRFIQYRRWRRSKPVKEDYCK